LLVRSAALVDSLQIYSETFTHDRAINTRMPIFHLK